ncbi:hypothetical protein B0T18DRAFT_206744 [Schizothecium vesticola]|uniref:Uncharacterized protein n=1 Tax=Schizothecium vesticola TaxID=314040 RepID=A0AA40EJ64_9PEZI|nr:hypothetical protein B0T18DRAFT_206744 [Schizothecium vesticola]
MLRGEAGVRRSAWMPLGILASQAGCLEPGLCVAVAVDQVVFCAWGFCIWMPVWASREGPQAKEEIPVQWKICRRQAWHRGERWVDGRCFVSQAWLVLPFSPVVSACLTETPDGALPRRGPVINGGDEHTLEQGLSQFCCLSHRYWRFLRPLPDIQREPMSACLSACGLSMCTGAVGGIHGGRMPPMPSSTDGILLRCILPNIASLGFSRLVHIEPVWGGQEKTTNNGDRHSRRPKRGAWQRRCRSGGPPPANSLFLRPRHAMRPAVSPFPPASWAGLGWAWCVCGAAGLWPKSHPQPTTSA